MRELRRAARSVVVGALAASAFVAYAPAARASLLSGAQTVSGPGAIDPEVAITPSGWTLVAWTTQDQHVQASWRPPGGLFGAPFTIAAGALGNESVVATSDDRVAIGWITPLPGLTAQGELLAPGDGDGHVATLSADGAFVVTAAADAHGTVSLMTADRSGLRVATRTAGGEIPAPATVAPTEQQLPSIATNAAGDTALVSETPNGPLTLRLRPPGTTTFGPPSNVPISAFATRVAVTDAGDVAIGAEPLPGAIGFARLAIRGRDGSYAVSSLPSVGILDLLGAPGNQLTILDQLPGSDFGGPIRSFDRLGDGTFGQPQEIAPAQSCLPSSVLTPREDTIVAVQEHCTGDGAGAFIALTERAAGSSYAPALPVSDPDSQSPAVAVNPSGAVALAWSHEPSPGASTADTIQVAVRDGSAELDLLDPVLAIVDGVVQVPAGCTGLRDCVGSLTLLATQSSSRSSRSRSVARRAARPIAARGVRVANGRETRVHLHVGHHVPRHARLVIRLRHVRGRAAHRTIKVRLRAARHR